MKSKHDNLAGYLEDIFKPYENSPGVKDLREELLHNLIDRYDDLIAEGQDQESAFLRTVSSLGDISELVESISEKSEELRSRFTWDLSRSSLAESKLDSTDLKSGKIHASNLSDSDLHDSDLSGSSFKSSDLKNNNFANANLSGASFKSCELAHCSFDGANLTACTFKSSNLKGASVKDAQLEGTSFSACELSGVRFDGMTLNNVTIKNSALRGTSFKNATLRHVVFKCKVKHAIFNGARMDKVTYALLKGYQADLSEATIF
ncbi:MAG: pentapeptide repeat-containing protein [Lentisphaeria bacterium]|nr:pentapeptide repeat-containing protein [Candidatus Neomarinimicrobiota bacterium]MCF7842952.1 pentapeptide repeat-containing protein [Lentisphaeria bacterium]